MNREREFDMLVDTLEKENIIGREKDNRELLYVYEKFREELIKQMKFCVNEKIDKLEFLSDIHNIDIPERVYYSSLIKTYLKNAKIDESKSIRIEELYKRAWLMTYIMIPKTLYNYSDIDVEDFAKVVIETAIIDSPHDELEEIMHFILNNVDSLEESVIKVFYSKDEDRVRLYIE